MARRPAVVTGPHPGGGWQNKIEGNQRASNVSATQGRSTGQRTRDGIARKTEHKIQNQKGQIKGRNSYGHDPFPPPG